MPSAKLKATFGSLRFRLMFWNTLVLFLLILATLFAVRTGLWLALLHETDLQLRDDLAEMKARTDESYPDLTRLQHDLERSASTHEHRGLYFKLIDQQGALVWASQRAPQLVLPHTIREAFGPISSGNYRLIQGVLNKPNNVKLNLRVGTLLAPLREDLTTLTRLLITVGGVALLIAPVGGYWLAGRATHPLAVIISTTNRLHPTDLDERLPLRGTRDELDQLSGTINGFLDRINAYLEQNRQFTANAAHELRSPLTAIQSSLEVALNVDRSSDEYKEILATVLEECGLLRKLVNQLLILSESDAQRTILSELVPLDRIIEKSCDMFSAVAEADQVKLVPRCQDRINVHGDAGRLRQVVNNLVDNALKFTPAGGQVTVSLEYRPVAHEAVLRVSDTGSGIAPEDLPHLFERFYRGDKSRQRSARGGTGLGLSICQSIIEAHGGSITPESTLGQGTTMIVTFPAASLRAATVEPVAS